MSISTVVVTAGQVPSQTTSAITVFVSDTQPIATATATTSDTSDITGQTLPASWIVAIISLILLAIESTVLLVLYHKLKKLKNSGSSYEHGHDRRHTQYYEMSRPAETHKSRVSRHRFSYAR